MGRRVGFDCGMCSIKGLPFSVILVLFWSLLTEMFNPALIHSVENFSFAAEAVETTALVILYLLLPLVGVYSDLKGRYWILLGSIVLGIVATCLFVTQANVDGIDWLIYVMYPLYIFSHGCITVVLLAFGSDQLNTSGASSQLISGYVWWMYWTFHMGSLVSVMAGCSSSSSYTQVYVDCAHFVCLMVFLVTSLISMAKGCMVIEPRSKNPLTTLVKVILYARKKRYPLSRRAVAQWEEDNPSRLDQAKLKYGGLFTEDEVEDIKSLFYIALFLLCVLIIYFPVRTVGKFEHRDGEESFVQCLFLSSHVDLYGLVVVLVPLLHFVPRRWTLRISMLYRITFGLLMLILASALFTGLNEVTQTMSPNATCTPDSYNQTQHNDSTSMQTYLIMLAPDLISDIGVVLVAATSFEFLFAQSPYGMRGFVLGIWSMISKIMELFGWKITLLIQKLVVSYPECETSVLIMNLVISSLSFGLYCIVAKCYKLRTRQTANPRSQATVVTACLANYGTLNSQ